CEVCGEWRSAAVRHIWSSSRLTIHQGHVLVFFFFKQKTAYEIGLGIPAEPLFRSELSRQMTTSTTSIDIMGLQAAYANLHTDQERDYFMQRYHDVISSFGGKTSYDADNRPLLVMRSNLWASGYDVDG